MKALDLIYLSDPDVQPFWWDYRQDLTAPAAQLETVADGIFIILKETVPKGQVALISGVTPTIYQRQNINTDQEFVAQLPTGAFSGLVAFNLEVTSLTAFISKINYNAPTQLASANNLVRATVRSGDAFPVREVHANVQNWNPLFRIAVPSETEARVTFQIIPQNQTVANQLPVYPFIGTEGVAGVDRIDWVGCVVSGVLMPQQKFNEMRARAAL